MVKENLVKHGKVSKHYGTDCWSIFGKADMNLQKWKRNSNKFMMFIKKHKKGKRLEVLEELSYADSSLNPSLIHDKKVLVIQ